MNFFLFRSDTAKASPKTSDTVVELVGANSNGHASIFLGIVNGSFDLKQQTDSVVWNDDFSDPTTWTIAQEHYDELLHNLITDDAK